MPASISGSGMIVTVCSPAAAKTRRETAGPPRTSCTAMCTSPEMSATEETATRTICHSPGCDGMPGGSEASMAAGAGRAATKAAKKNRIGNSHRILGLYPRATWAELGSGSGLCGFVSLSPPR